MLVKLTPDDVIGFQVVFSGDDEIERQYLQCHILRRKRVCRIPFRTKIDVVESPGP